MSPRTSRLPRHALIGATQPQVAAVISRAVALVGVAAIGSVILAAGGARDEGLTTTAGVAAMTHRPDRPVEQQAAPRAAVAPRPVHHAAARPKPAPAPAPAEHRGKAKTHAASPRHWLPSGTGMWLYEWSHTNNGNAASIIAQARRTGLTTLYLRTGSSWDGLSGGQHLVNLLRASHGSPVHVVAWDFPRLRHPVRDALRLARAARLRGGPNGPRVSAVAPDIETPSEGTFNAAWRVHAYLAALHRHLPKGVTILGTVPWPSRYRIADYPYGTVAAGSDALIPMTYWYNNPPAMVTARSIGYLRDRFHLPVMPVGQGYDGKLDVPSLRHNHLAREVPNFFRTAKRHGARAVSLWSWQAAPPVAWRALDRAAGMFRPKH